jgi:penicillin amidase
MQVLRQTGRGRLAEDRGMAFVKGDFLLRLLEIEKRAQALSLQIVGEDRAWLEAYAEGVNQGNPAVFSQDPWRVADTVLLLLLQSFDQTRRTFEQDLATDRHLRSGHPLEQSFPWETPILKPGEYTLGAQEAWTRLPPRNQVLPFSPEDQASGSNNWVIAKKHTRSGSALLANDPHLQLKSPPFWHWVKVIWPGVEFTGSSLPGVPLIASGASTHLAWGLTNSFIDVADAVLVSKQGLSLRKIRPVVWVRRFGIRFPIFWKHFEIVSGAEVPVLPLESPDPASVIALRWSGFDLTAADLSALWRLDEGKRVEDFDQILSRVGVPSWNFVFADTSGKIGYRAVGRLPKRSWKPQGMLEQVSPSALRFTDFLSPEEAPHLLNPARGWIATANQIQWRSDSRFSVGSAHTESFRAFRIEEKLKQGLSAKHDLESMRRIQCDAQAVDARFLLPVLLPHLEPSAEVTRLSRWDFEAGLDCQECALFRLWMKALGDPQWVYSRALEGKPEFRAEAQAAFHQAVEVLRRRYQNPWVKWGAVHRAVFPLTEALRPFSLTMEDSLSTIGDDHSVSPGSSDWIEQAGLFSHHSGPSQRMVVELSTPPRIHWVLPGANRAAGASHGVNEKEKATSPEREAWAGCQFTSESSSGVAPQGHR